MERAGKFRDLHHASMMHTVYEAYLSANPHSWPEVASSGPGHVHKALLFHCCIR